MSNGNRNVASLVGGVGLVLLGLLFLVLQILDVDFWSFAWPLFIMVPGLLFFVGMFSGGKSAAGLAIPGSILTMLGALFFYQNAFDQWQSWAYAWALLWPTAVGIGMVIQGVWGEQPRAAQTGRQLIRVGLLIFLGGLVFFELIIGIGGWGFFSPGVRAYLGPILLILAGAFVLLRHGILGARGQNANPPGRQD
jgi:hypothetical protein